MRLGGMDSRRRGNHVRWVHGGVPSDRHPRAGGDPCARLPSVAALAMALAALASAGAQTATTYHLACGDAPLTQWKRSPEAIAPETFDLPASPFTTAAQPAGS